MTRSLNLATRPFRNETLPRILWIVAAVAVSGVTAWHGLVVRRLLPSRTSALNQELRALEAEAAALRKEAAGFREAKLDPAVAKQWSFVKDLVDRRTFSWTELFSRLEDTLPLGVRLLSIAPAMKGGEVSLEIAAIVRSNEEGLAFVRILEERSEFDWVYPMSEGESGGSWEFRYTMRYRPQAAPPRKETPSPEASPVTQSTAESVEDAPQRGRS